MRPLRCALDDRPVLNVSLEGPRGQRLRTDERRSSACSWLRRSLERRTSSGRLSIGSVQERSLMTGDKPSILPVPGKVPEGRNSITTAVAGRWRSRRDPLGGRAGQIGRCPGSAQTKAVAGTRLLSPRSSLLWQCAGFACTAGASKFPEGTIVKIEFEGTTIASRQDQAQAIEPGWPAAQPREGRGRPEDPDRHQVVFQRRLLDLTRRHPRAANTR